MNIIEAAQQKGVQVKSIQKILQDAGFSTSKKMDLDIQHLKVLNISNGVKVHPIIEQPTIQLRDKKINIPTGWDMVNYLEMVLIAWELYMIWGYESIVVTLLFFCFIYSSQRIAKNPKLKKSQRIAFVIVAIFSAISACLHTYFFEEAMTIESWAQWMKTTTAVSMAIIVSGMSFFAVYITHHIQHEQ